MNVVALNAFIFVGGLTLLAFYVARMAFAEAVGSKRFMNWFLLYFSITICVFVVSNFWVFIFLIFCLTLLFGAREPIIPALFALTVLSVPAKGAWISGFGIVNNLLYVTPADVIQVAILALLAMRASQRNDRRYGGGIADMLLIFYAVLVMLLAFRDTTFTNGLRIGVVFALSTLPAYFIFSRMRWDAKNIRITTISLLTPMIALAGVAVFEVATSWHFYSAAVTNWGIPYQGIYVQRGGFLRAYGTLMGPIAFGAMMMVGFALAPAVLQDMKNKMLGRMGFLALGGGILAAFSRAPWLGSGLAFGLHALTDKKAFSSLSRLALLGVAAAAILAVTPFGSAVLGSLPGFGGSTDQETISYRQQLLKTGIEVVRDNPLFGSTSFLERDDLEELRQGQGIIDLVNTYLDIAMRYGLVGLFFFVGVKVIALFNIWRSIGRARLAIPELAPYCQAYFAALGSLMFVLFTTTNTIGQFEQVVWLVVGTSIGLTRIVNEAFAGYKAKAATPVAEEGQIIEALAEGQSGPVAGAAASASSTKPKIDATQLPPHLRQYLRRTD